MKIENKMGISLFLGFIIGVVLSLLAAKGFTMVSTLAKGKAQETAIVSYYNVCREFYEKKQQSPESWESLVEFCKQECPQYADIVSQKSNSIQFRRLSNDTWIVFALEGGLGFVVAERVKVGESFHRRMTKVSPRYHIIENDE